jgi:HEAT repeat protein
VNALFAEDTAVRQAAAQALIKIGAPSIPYLLQAIAVNDCSEEMIAFENRLLRQVYVQIGEPAFQAVIKALHTHDHKRAMVKLLTLFKDARAVPVLIEWVLREPGQGARLYAIDALGYFQDPRAFEPLLTVLSSRDLGAVSAAAHAIAEYRDARALEPLQRARAAAAHDWVYPALNDAARMIREPGYTQGYRGYFVQMRGILGL